MRASRHRLVHWSAVTGRQELTCAEQGSRKVREPGWTRATGKLCMWCLSTGWWQSVERKKQTRAGAVEVRDVPRFFLSSADSWNCSTGDTGLTASTTSPRATLELYQAGQMARGESVRGKADTVG